MKHLSLLCTVPPALFLVFILCFVVVSPGHSAQAGEPTRQILTVDHRHYLEQALEDSRLPRWQQSIATNLLNPSQVGPIWSRGELPRETSAGVDGAWSQILLESRSGQAAIYDPTRDRMLVFGGYGTYDLFDDVWALSFSASPPWTKLTTSGTPPLARNGHTAIYDPIRDRMIIFGGSGEYGVGDLNDVWSLSLSGTSEWKQLNPAGTPPIGRFVHSAIYDPVRDRMLIFGGRDGSFAFFTDVWALSLSGTPQWTQLPTAIPFTPRAGTSAIYDPVRDRVLFFGGDDDGYPFPSDTWALSLSGAPQWTQLTPEGTLPPGRAYHTAIYDPGRDAMVVYGGAVWSLHRNDTWILSLAEVPTWTQITSTAPSSRRSAHTAIYDSARSRMVVFGGEDDQYYPDRNDVWTLSLLGSPEWTPGPGMPPSARSGHTAIYDGVSGRMVVFGGSDNDVYGGRNDVWALSTSANPEWTELFPTGTPPSPRSGHTAIYDPLHSRMLVFGGYDWSDGLNDVWALSLSGSPAWTRLNPTGPPPPAGAGYTAIYDPVRNRMVVFAGSSVSALSLSGTGEWTMLTPTGTPPPALSGHTAIYDPVRDRMVVFGGSDVPYPYRNEVWVLTFSGGAEWSQLAPTGTLPSGKRGHTAIYDPVRDRMVVYSGESVSYDGDAWALSLSGTPTWTLLVPAGTRPGGRHDHAAIYDPVHDRMVIFAGTVDMHSDWENVWALDWGTVTAVQPSPTHLANALRPCYPNPFNPRVTIPFEVKQDGNVTLAIYDVAGRLVKTMLSEWTQRGLHTVNWDGRSESGDQVSSGVYFYRMQVGKFTESKKMVLLK